MSAATPIDRWPGLSGQEMARWTTAAAFVAAAHLSIAYVAGTIMMRESRPAVEEALTIDLTPFIMTQAEQEQPDVLREDTPEPVLEDVQPQEIVEQVAEAQPVEEAETTPDELSVETEKDAVEPDTPDTLTEAIETPPAEVVVPKPVGKPVEKKAEKTPRKVIRKPAPRRVTATDPAKGKSSTTQAEAKVARAPSVNPARWHSQVYAAIARRKPHDRGVSGRVSIRFIVNASGAIVSAGVARSSGNSALDSAALAMVRGARVPAPPANLPGSRHPFTIPVVFQ